jgi:CO/xanthine dehydrogenase FAD-binding subunit
MEFFRPTSLAEALDLRAAHPQARPLCGGTDVMVELNFDRGRPAGLLDLTAVPELRGWERRDGTVRLGAAATYAQVVDELGRLLPALAIASRSVGSPQIRNRGTVGGNLGSASPAGDAHPALLAAGADVELASVRGTRRVAVSDFFTGPKRSVLAPDELVTAVHVPVAGGPQQFSKVGTRNAMVIAVCSFSVALHPAARAVGTGIGSAAPTPRRAPEAETWLAETLEREGAWHERAPLPPEVPRRFGDLVAAAASPIDDVRGTAAYRRHALSVLARRTLTWTWDEYTRAESGSEDL